MQKSKPTQLPLFQNTPSEAGYNYSKQSIIYNNISASDATFKAGLLSPIHRWFRLTPSFSPQLVREMLSKLNYQKNEIVLDPFSGAGTTLIECQLNGIESYGFEINPFLQFVGNTCLNWQINPSELRVILEELKIYFHNSLINLDKLNLIIPPIHNPHRWWREDILNMLLALKDSINIISPTRQIRDFFRLGLAGVLIPDLTNVTLGRLQLHFIDRSADDIQVWDTFYNHVNKMITDIEGLFSKGLSSNSSIFLTDTTNSSHIHLNRQANCVITSPPYPNRYSYVWNTRPYLYLFDFFENPTEASNLDKLTIGGTWGTATSVLSKGIINPEYKIIEDKILPIINRIRQKDNLMANYVMKYFNMLAKQILDMEQHVDKNTRVAYVVGCSRIKEIFIETDLLLAEIFEGLDLGYNVKSIERIRKRNSGKDLYESIIYAWKN